MHIFFWRKLFKIPAVDLNLLVLTNKSRISNHITKHRDKIPSATEILSAAETLVKNSFFPILRGRENCATN